MRQCAEPAEVCAEYATWQLQGGMYPLLSESEFTELNNRSNSGNSLNPTLVLKET